MFTKDLHQVVFKVRIAETLSNCIINMELSWVKLCLPSWRKWSIITDKRKLRCLSHGQRNDVGTYLKANSNETVSGSVPLVLRNRNRAFKVTTANNRTRSKEEAHNTSWKISKELTSVSLILKMRALALHEQHIVKTKL